MAYIKICHEDAYVNLAKQLKSDQIFLLQACKFYYKVPIN